MHSTPTKSVTSHTASPYLEASIEPFNGNASSMHTTPSSNQNDRPFSKHTPGVNSPPHTTLQTLQDTWVGLSTGIKENATVGAEVLVRHASAVSQLDDFMSHMLLHVQGVEWERGQLRRQLQQDRAEFTAQAKLLSGHFQVSQHRSTALQVAHEALQAELQQTKQGADLLRQENTSLIKQLAHQQAEAALHQAQKSTTEASHQTLVTEHQALQQQLEIQTALVQELKQTKGQLQSQVKGMVAAEQTLTDHLKVTHMQIDEQLQQLREQLKGERQKRVAAQKKKAELAQQVERMAQQLEMLTQQEGEAKVSGSPKPGPRLHTAMRASTKRSFIKLARGPTGSPSSSKATTASAVPNRTRPTAQRSLLGSSPTPSAPSTSARPATQHSSPSAAAAHPTSQRQSPSTTVASARTPSPQPPQASSVDNHKPLMPPNSAAATRSAQISLRRNSATASRATPSPVSVSSSAQSSHTHSFSTPVQLQHEPPNPFPVTASIPAHTGSSDQDAHTPSTPDSKTADQAHLFETLRYNSNSNPSTNSTAADFGHFSHQQHMQALPLLGSDGRAHPDVPSTAAPPDVAQGPHSIQPVPFTATSPTKMLHSTTHIVPLHSAAPPSPDHVWTRKLAVDDGAQAPHNLNPTFCDQRHSPAGQPAPIDLQAEEQNAQAARGDEDGATALDVTFSQPQQVAQAADHNAESHHDYATHSPSTSQHSQHSPYSTFSIGNRDLPGIINNTQRKFAPHSHAKFGAGPDYYAASASPASTASNTKTTQPTGTAQTSGYTHSQQPLSLQHHPVSSIGEHYPVNFPLPPGPNSSMPSPHTVSTMQGDRDLALPPHTLYDHLQYQQHESMEQGQWQWQVAGAAAQSRQSLDVETGRPQTLQDVASKKGRSDSHRSGSPRYDGRQGGGEPSAKSPNGRTSRSGSPGATITRTGEEHRSGSSRKPGAWVP